MICVQHIIRIACEDKGCQVARNGVHFTSVNAKHTEGNNYMQPLRALWKTIMSKLIALTMSAEMTLLTPFRKFHLAAAVRTCGSYTPVELDAHLFTSISLFTYHVLKDCLGNCICA